MNTQCSSTVRKDNFWSSLRGAWENDSLSGILDRVRIGDTINVQHVCTETSDLFLVWTEGRDIYCQLCHSESLASYLVNLVQPFKVCDNCPASFRMALNEMVAKEFDSGSSPILKLC